MRVGPGSCACAQRPKWTPVSEGGGGLRLLQKERKICVLFYVSVRRSETCKSLIRRSLKQSWTKDSILGASRSLRTCPRNRVREDALDLQARTGNSSRRSSERPLPPSSVFYPSSSLALSCRHAHLAIAGSLPARTPCYIVGALWMLFPKMHSPEY